MLTAFNVEVLYDNIIYKKGKFQSVDWAAYVALTDGDGNAVNFERVTVQTSALNGEAQIVFSYRTSDGSEVDAQPVIMYLYYEVSSVEEWTAVNDDLSAWYAQTCDIDFAGCNLSASSLSIARAVTADSPSSAKSFDGVYDGNGYALKNYIDTSKNYSSVFTQEVYVQSLFAKIGKRGKVRNLCLENVKIFSRNFTGLLVGENYGTVSDVHLKDCEVLNMYGAGGLVAAYNYGNIYFTVIENCNVRISNIQNDYVLAFVNNGRIAQSLCSGVRILDGAAGAIEHAKSGTVCGGNGLIKNVNGSDGTAYENISITGNEMKKHGFLGNIWKTGGVASLKSGSLANRNNSVLYYLDEWIVQNRVWGFTGEQTHGGVIADNVTYDGNGNLIFIANGDLYEGEKLGVDAEGQDYSARKGGKRTGSVIRSRKTYGPGSFEAEMKIPSFNGICTSIWLFNYMENDGAEDSNYEIDIEIHGTAVNEEGKKINENNLSSVLCTSWLTETNFISETKSVGYPLNDGEFHRFRIDWHTGASPRVEYYVDGVLVCVQTTHVPDTEMYLNIGCWFPNNWCGQPDFETDFMTLKSFAYKPFKGETADKRASVEDGAVDNEYYHPWAQPVEENLLANGNFDSSRKDFVWRLPSGAVKGDGVTFDGTASQRVTADCGGVQYALSLSGKGNAQIKLSYGSIVNGVTVGGSKTFSFGSDVTAMKEFAFTPPENCTALDVEIISEGSFYLKSANLKIS